MGLGLHRTGPWRHIYICAHASIGDGSSPVFGDATRIMAQGKESEEEGEGKLLRRRCVSGLLEYTNPDRIESIVLVVYELFMVRV